MNDLQILGGSLPKVKKLKLCKSQRDTIYACFPDQTSHCAECNKQVCKDNSVIKSLDTIFTAETTYVLCRRCWHSNSGTIQADNIPWESAVNRRQRILTHYLVEFLKHNQSYNQTGLKYVMSVLQGEFCLTTNTIRKYISLITGKNSPIKLVPMKMDMRMYISDDVVNTDETSRLVLADPRVISSWYEKQSAFFNNDSDDSLYKGAIIDISGEVVAR